MFQHHPEHGLDQSHAASVNGPSLDFVALSHTGLMLLSLSSDLTTLLCAGGVPGVGKTQFG